VAVAVVLSLVFVSIQIRQNTRAIQGQSIATATLISQTELQTMMNSDTRVAYLKSIESPESLTTDDLVLLDVFNTMFVTGRENDYLQYRLGTLDDELWQRTLGGISGVLSSRWGRHWWSTVGKHLVSVNFVPIVDKALENPTYAIDVYYENLKLK
jgi:hypothetical protein